MSTTEEEEIAKRFKIVYLERENRYRVAVREGYYEDPSAWRFRDMLEFMLE
jgi:hypothetical protein